VRQRASRDFGGAAGSVGAVKQRRIVFAARHFLLRYAAPPPCRFDVVTLEAGRLDWLRGAFNAD
jgi:putative endonuclease